MVDLQEYINTYFGIHNKNADTVASLFTRSKLKKGEYFVKQGNYCEKMSFIRSGYIRVFANAKDKEITQWISSKGYFVTDVYSFIFRQRARWNMQALTDCNLYTIHKENFERLHNLIPQWNEIEKKLIANCFITLEDRVFNHLSLSAEERYDQLFEQDKTLFNQVPLHYLASMLGMSAETFSRIRSKKIS